MFYSRDRSEVEGWRGERLTLIGQMKNFQKDVVLGVVKKDRKEH